MVSSPSAAARRAGEFPALAVVFAAALLAATLAAASAAAAEPAPERASFDYFYIEANEGGSSGGHAAVRFGPQVFHFQNRAGLLVLDREQTPSFLHAYTLLSNRTIHSSRVALTDADAESLRATFDQRYHIQQRQLDVGKALARDLELLATWREGRTPDVPGLGYFEAGGSRAAAVESLRERIAARYGGGFLEARRSEALERLSSIAASDPTDWPATPPRTPEEVPPFARPWASRYDDAAAGVAAVDVLEHGLSLAPDATVVLRDASGWLDDAERAALLAARTELSGSLVRLAGSPRSDWGRPFLVSVARLLTFDASLASGRRVVLDSLPKDGPWLPHSVLADRPALVAQMILAGRRQTEDARGTWTQANERGAGAASERLLSRIEEAASRVAALERSARQGSDLPLARGTLVPARSGATRTPLPRPSLPGDETRIEIATRAVQLRSERHRAAMLALYRYQLIERNCVSELFHTLNAGLGRDSERIEEALGGYVDGHGSLSFIPFVSARAVDRSYRVVQQQVVPSYREIRIGEMLRNESDWRVVLRESNTLTAHSYRRGIRDSYFVFFTEDPVWLRPIFGAVNLVAAVFESVWGLARLPVDGGETLVSGLAGALVSLPELAFFNIRKGSNDWVATRPLYLEGSHPDGPGEATERDTATDGTSR